MAECFYLFTSAYVESYTPTHTHTHTHTHRKHLQTDIHTFTHTHAGLRRVSSPETTTHLLRRRRRALLLHLLRPEPWRRKRGGYSWATTLPVGGCHIQHWSIQRSRLEEGFYIKVLFEYSGRTDLALSSCPLFLATPSCSAPPPPPPFPPLPSCWGKHKDREAESVEKKKKEEEEEEAEELDTRRGMMSDDDVFVWAHRRQDRTGW